MRSTGNDASDNENGEQNMAVLGVGLEPTSLAALAPKASAFAISPPQQKPS